MNDSSELIRVLYHSSIYSRTKRSINYEEEDDDAFVSQETEFPYVVEWLVKIRYASELCAFMDVTVVVGIGWRFKIDVDNLKCARVTRISM